MTVVIGIMCSDGVVLASDSMTTFGRGVPIFRYSNKVHVINHDHLSTPVALGGAGMTTYVNKFMERAARSAIEAAFNPETKEKLDIVDFCERVAEPVVASLLKEYQIDRNDFFEAPMTEYSLSMIIAGATNRKEFRAYFVHDDGLTEPLDHHGAVGSGAAYAELFLRYLLADKVLDCNTASRLAVYAIKGVELMDPNVGGDPSVLEMKVGAKGRIQCSGVPSDRLPSDAKEKMRDVLTNMSSSIAQLLNEGKPQ